jgi:hypothetical protein
MVTDKGKLPTWVSWLAQDADGVWWGYEFEPQQHDSGWYENEVGRCLRVAEGEVDGNWRQRLKRLR